MTDATHYVYVHRDPRTGEVVYIGSGTGDRAWTIRGRGPEHQAWFAELRREGFQVGDAVTLLTGPLTEICSRDYEWFLTQRVRPRFDRQSRRKYSWEQVADWRARHAAGHSFEKIARESDSGASAETVRTCCHMVLIADLPEVPNCYSLEAERLRYADGLVLSPEQRAEVIKAARHGKASAPELAKQYGVSVSVIYRVLDKAAVPRRRLRKVDPLIAEQVIALHQEGKPFSWIAKKFELEPWFVRYIWRRREKMLKG
jgi:hypothetical protein